MGQMIPTTESRATKRMKKQEKVRVQTVFYCDFDILYFDILPSAKRMKNEFIFLFHLKSHVLFQSVLHYVFIL